MNHPGSTIELEERQTRDLAKAIAVDGPLVFESKTLKKLRPFMRSVSAHMHWNRPVYEKNHLEFEKLLKQHLGDPKTSLGFNKWATMAVEIINATDIPGLQTNFELLRMWIDSYHDGWTGLRVMNHSTDFLRFQKKYFFHLIETNNAQDLKKIVEGLSVEEREWFGSQIPSISINDDLFQKFSNSATTATATGATKAANYFGMLAVAVKQSQLAPVLDVAVVFPEYFKWCVENNLSLYINFQNEWRLPLNIPLDQLSDRMIQARMREYIQRIAKCMDVLPMDKQKEMARKIKDRTKNDPRIWEASPLLKALGENLLLSDNLPPTEALSRRAKI